MRILIPTDAFPPICGGSGWSTHALARDLRARGHDVRVVQPRPGTPPGIRERIYDGFCVREFGAPAPDLPYVRNYFKNERLYATFADYLASLIAAEPVDVVHAQHVLTTVPSVDAGRRTRVPVVATVRDYWPVCYWSDLIHTRHDAALCPGCSAAMMTRCIRPRAGVAWPLALSMIPYMRANLARKRSGLAGADAIIAVSSTIASDLRARAPEVASSRIDVIPNAVDIADLRARAAASTPPLPGPYALYLGKLAPNKGTEHLVRVAEEAGLDWPLLIAGDGPDRALLENAVASSDRDVRLLGWTDRDVSTALLAHAAMLIFPSRGPESLSRVLIEASALGIPIAAMVTGGTADIILHGQTGLLSKTPDSLADDVRRLRADANLRTILGEAAALRARAHFDTSAVVPRIERVYDEVIRERRR